MATFQTQSLGAVKFNKRFFSHLTMGLSILTAMSSAAANESLAYSCEVKSVAWVNDDGSIKQLENDKKHFYSSYIGSKFKVVKATGEIDGAIVSNKSAATKSTTIIDKGASDQSYKVMSVFGPKPSILYLQIDDYGSARGKGRYPFSAFRWMEFLTGICN